MTEANTFLQNNKYESALESLKQAQGIENSEEVQSLIKNTLIKAFEEQYNNHDYVKAKKYLERLVPYISPQALAYFNQFLQEESALVELEKLLQERNYKGAKQLLKSSNSNDFKNFKVREERKIWIEAIEEALKQ